MGGIAAAPQPHLGSLENTFPSALHPSPSLLPHSLAPFSGSCSDTSREQSTRDKSVQPSSLLPGLWPSCMYREQPGFQPVWPSSISRELLHLTQSIDWLMSHLFASGYSAVLPLLID